MSRSLVVTTLLWLALVVVIIGGAGMYRYFLIAPELRFPAIEARWHLVPLLSLLLVLIALLLRSSDSGPRKPSS